MMKIIAEIPARGGSKGIPRKALQTIGDLPLIAYTVKDALRIDGITKVFVNTDDPEIQEVSIQYGAEVPFLRPADLARDDSNLADAHLYALDWYKRREGFVPDIAVVMSPTHPFRRKNLINNALATGLRNSTMYNIGSIAPVKALPNNYWVASNGRFEALPLCNGTSLVRIPLYQSAFSFNMVYYFRSGLPNRRVPVILNEIESIDIDEPLDLEVARMVISEGLYPFES